MGELSYTVGGDNNLVSFKSAARVPITSLKAHFKPKQDLHGYSKPWPAGGGNNIWDEQWEVGRFDTTTGENVDNNEQIRCKNYIPVSPNTEYRFVGSYSMWIIPYDENKNVLQSHFFENNVATNGNSSTFNAGSIFTTPNDCYFIRFYLVTSYGITYNNNIAINYPSSVTTYSPYENICPIEGWNSAKVWLFSNNLLQVIPTSASSYNMSWTVDNNGIITYEGTPTSYSSVNCGRVYLNGRTKIYGRIFGDTANIAFNTLHIYDSSEKRIGAMDVPWEGGGSTSYATADLSNYPNASYVVINTKRASNNVYTKGTSYVFITDDKQYLQIPVTFPSTGKNLFNLDTATTDAFIRADNVTDEYPLGSLVTNRTNYVSSDYINVFPSTVYTAHHPYLSIASAAGMVYYTIDKEPISGISIYNQLLNNNTGNYTFTTPDNCYYIRISYDNQNGNEFQLEQGDTATSYEPYSSDNIFYGGYVDVAAGEIVAEWAEIDLGSVEWSLRQDTAVRQAWYNNDIQVKSVSGSHTPINGYSDIFEPVGYSDTWKPYCIAPNTSGSTFSDVAICFELGKYSSGSEVATAMSGIKFVYQLKTPIRYPISKQQLQAYINYNTALSNMNDITELSYALHDTAPIRAAKKRMAAENDKHYRKVLWNQMAGPMTSQYWELYNTNNTSVEFIDDYAEVTTKQIKTYGYDVSIRTKNDIQVTTNHRYYASYLVYPEFSDGKFGMEFAGGMTIGAHDAPINEWTRISAGRVKGYRVGGGALYIPYFVNGTYQVGDKAKVKNVIYIDLTKMFGMGNEPTKAEFEKLCAINNIDLTTYHPIDSGTEQIWCIPGHDTSDYTVVNWNQRGKEVNSSNYRAYNSNYIDITFEDNAIVSTWLSEGSEYLYSVCANYNRTHTLGNYFYLSYEYYTDIDGYIGGDVGGETTTYKRTTTNQWTRYSDIKQRTTSGNFTNAVVYVSRFNETVKPKAGNYCKARNIIAIDLTQMFGAGNEPLTVDDLYAACLKNNINLDEAQPYTTGSTIIWRK